MGDLALDQIFEELEVADLFLSGGGGIGVLLVEGFAHGLGVGEDLGVSGELGGGLAGDFSLGGNASLHGDDVAGEVVNGGVDGVDLVVEQVLLLIVGFDVGFFDGSEVGEGGFEVVSEFLEQGAQFVEVFS